MPKYVYAVLNEDGSVKDYFEVEQRMTDPPLEKHPETGEKVKRVYLPPHVSSGKWTERAMQRNMADDRKLERLGFTKYVKTEKGYEKVAGKGPDRIARPRN